MSEKEIIRGPHGWLNWVAERHASQPRRTGSHPDAMVIRPIWEEFALYSDAQLEGGELSLGPYEFLLVDRVESPSLGRARKLLVARMWDHLSDAPRATHEIDDDVTDYFGGNVGDELAVLLGLALGRRIRSGGSVRQELPIEHLPLGLISEQELDPPALEPPRRRAMIEGLADPISLDQASDLLDTYPDLDGADAIALIRAAQQYVDGLWLADADPRLAWIKLIGALEVGAGRHDDERQKSPIEQLKRHRRKLYNAVKDSPEALEAVAEEFARLFNAERKVRSFVEEYDPGPPPRRPAQKVECFNWPEVGEAIGVIYNHRSRDLHDGIAFPWPLCQPPEIFQGDMPAERFAFLAITSHGGQWQAQQLPMFLHVFAHLVGGCLRQWWRSLASATD